MCLILLPPPTNGTEMNFDVNDVMAVSCAIQRINNGFIKKGFGTDEQQSNSSYLYEHFCEGKVVPVLEDDQKLGVDVIDYLQGLGFKALERDLTEFERKVLGLVTSEKIDKSTLGIAASLPNVYLNKVKSDNWADRERELGLASEFLGTESTRCDFVGKVEFSRYIPATDSRLITCSVGGSILKFFLSDRDVVITKGIDYNITGFVKPYRVNNYTGFKETMINRVKVAAVA
jgi:hypothetical protein|tara:strand:+ start:1270 stop:1962 length:693 start_codon:yes stop_codon:yes gene_type:complete